MTGEAQIADDQLSAAFDSLSATANRIADERNEAIRLLRIICANAETQPDARMEGSTDIYAVPIDDIDEAAIFLAEVKRRTAA